MSEGLQTNEVSKPDDLTGDMIAKFGGGVISPKRANDLVLISGDQGRVARLVMKSRSPVCRPGEEFLGQILVVTDALVTEATAVNKETGAEVSFPRTTLFMADGTACRFSSQYVFESLIQIMAMSGKPTIDVPWFVIPIKSRTAHNRNMICLTLPEPEELDELLGIIPKTLVPQSPKPEEKPAETKPAKTEELKKK